MPPLTVSSPPLARMMSLPSPPLNVVVASVPTEDLVGGCAGEGGAAVLIGHSNSCRRVWTAYSGQRVAKRAA